MSTEKGECLHCDIAQLIIEDGERDITVIINAMVEVLFDFCCNYPTDDIRNVMIYLAARINWASDLTFNGKWSEKKDDFDARLN